MQTPDIAVKIQGEDFSASEQERELLPSGAAAGATVAFTGYVRDVNAGDDVAVMELEHYPGMTEKSLVPMAAKATGLTFEQLVIRILEQTL